MNQHWYKEAVAALRKQTTLAVIRKRRSALKLRADAVKKSKRKSSEDDVQAAASVLLMEFVVLQLSRLANFVRGPNDLLAYTVRNLIECSIWCESITNNREAAEKFWEDVFIEQRELLDGLAPDALAMYEDFSDTSDRSGQLKQLGIDPQKLAKSLHNMVMATEGRRTAIKKRKQKAGELQLFRSCSKYLHPSAWLLSELTERLSDDTSRRVLLDDALRYAEECIKPCEGT